MAANIIVNDCRVTDYQSLIDGLTKPAEVFILDATSDALDQMVALLEGHPGIDALHIIPHGSSGMLYWGSAVLSAGNL